MLAGQALVTSGVESSAMELSTEWLIEQARLSGIALSPERAEALRPLLESLLGRLGRMAETLPREATPPASRVPRNGP